MPDGDSGDCADVIESWGVAAVRWNGEVPYRDLVRGYVRIDKELIFQWDRFGNDWYMQRGEYRFGGVAQGYVQRVDYVSCLL